VLDKLVVHFIDGEAEKLVFTGFRQSLRNAKGAQDITGEALTVNFILKEFVNLD
jgi:lipopolysaccharide export system protein LptA